MGGYLALPFAYRVLRFRAIPKIAMAGISGRKKSGFIEGEELSDARNDMACAALVGFDPAFPHFGEGDIDGLYGRRT
jgi:hypothetical protein